MTRSHFTPNSHTVARLASLRKLVNALTVREMTRAEIAKLLGIGESAARTYIADLREHLTILHCEAAVTWPLKPGVYRLTADPEAIAACLKSLGGVTAVRPVRASSMEIAARDPRRHFHILGDDEHYAVRVSRAAPARDPMVAALFGAGPASVGAHA
ncbi:ArsR family transcriptional regulator [Herbaspirillum sp. SJZ107]|uniref:ArsR family transcriptional regulator n=1 Tax=Herbaspirillum sp. SJZ107 TaxID=2572881 RepID=UPI00115487B5|nr:ArsR family transcriptional regulator [Herbaspirillum sp. SJZ107]TQK10215.1 hypothetical protein FBX97_0131 [Herbaspirillum sp. SJZ107]